MAVIRHTPIPIIALLCYLSPILSMGQDDAKTRIIVLTDISSLTQNVAEPDDGQSLIRLMLYTNQFDVEGLVATSNLRHGQRTRPELIHQVIDAYRQVYANLSLHDKDYPDPKKLLSVIKSGQPVAGPRLALEESIGDGKDTEASNWIIRVVDKDDPRPVWVTIWGGSADLAQALWKVKGTRTPEAVKKFVGKLRVHAVYDQDQTAGWIKTTFPELFYIYRHHGIRGMYRGGDTTLVGSQWVETNIRNNHGNLGSLYVNYHGGDVWSGKLGRVRGIKEGDTPSFLYLVANGLNAPEHPDWGSWSGLFKRGDDESNLWVEQVDSIGTFLRDPDPRIAALYRWRQDWQADFAARLDWCANSFENANHPPILKGNKVEQIVAKAGHKVKLSAPKMLDPDKDQLGLEWIFYPSLADRTGIKLTTHGRSASFVAPLTKAPVTIHVILKVTDNGEPSLTSYRRYVVLVQP